MILGVMSDTHGNRVLAQLVAEQMTEEHRAGVIFHLGDYYEDGEALQQLGYEVRFVPGLWCPAYREGHIRKTVVETFAGVTVAAAHAEKDLRRVERAAGVILLGHTHEARIERRGESIYFNPGHLKAEVSRGERASYGIVEIGETSIFAAIYEITGLVRLEAEFRRGKPV